MSLYFFFFFSYQIQRGAWLNVRVLWFGSRRPIREEITRVSRIIKRYPFARRPNVLFIRTVSLIYSRDENAGFYPPRASLSLSLQSLLCLPFVTPLFYLSSSLIASMKRFNAFFSFFFSSSFSPFLQWFSFNERIELIKIDNISILFRFENNLQREKVDARNSEIIGNRASVIYFRFVFPKSSRARSSRTMAVCPW